MHQWTFSPKRVLMISFGTFILGVETVLIAIYAENSVPATTILLQNGLVSLAVLLAISSLFLTARQQEATSG